MREERKGKEGRRRMQQEGKKEGMEEGRKMRTCWRVNGKEEELLIRGRINWKRR